MKSYENNAEQFSFACKINLVLIEMHKTEQDYSLKELSYILKVSERTICRYFAKHFKITFSQFKQELSKKRYSTDMNF
jgi:AraC-like DNA-binding protein